MSEVTTAFVGLDVHKDSMRFRLQNPAVQRRGSWGPQGRFFAEVERALSHCGPPPELLVACDFLLSTVVAGRKQQF